MKGFIAVTAAVAMAVTAGAAITITPSKQDFGQAMAPGGYAHRQFILTTDVKGEMLTLLVSGPEAGNFEVFGKAGGTTSCVDSINLPATRCEVEMRFVPRTVGVKTATFIVTNARGQTAYATLQGEGVKAGCQPVLVDCNYANLYSGSITVSIADSVASTDHFVRNETEIVISVLNGKATCSGQRREVERLGYKGTFDTEIKGHGDISGPGLLAIEFQREGLFNEKEKELASKAVYVLSAACPTPRMIRSSTNLPSGAVQVDTEPGLPADWRDAERLADPQPSTGEGMTTLTGTHANTRWDRENSAGGSTRTKWSLRITP